MSGAGRQSIFGKRDGGSRVQGVLPKTDAVLFEAARAELTVLAKKYLDWRGPISDADTIVYLARGHDMTVIYLKRLATQR